MTSVGLSPSGQALVKIPNPWKILSSMYLQDSCCTNLPILFALTACLKLLWEQFNCCRTVGSLLNMPEFKTCCVKSLVLASPTITSPRRNRKHQMNSVGLTQISKLYLICSTNA